MSLQMTCPYCKKEFPYDNGYLDYKISSKGQELLKIRQRLTKIKNLPKSEKNYFTLKERKNLIEKENKINIELKELKTVRKQCDQQIHIFEYETFKNIIKDKYGESEFRNILDQVTEELQAYKISGLAHHEYTRSGSKQNVTSINKL